MARITQSAPKLRQRLLIFIIEDVPLLWYIMGFIVVVIGFGASYALFTPIGHGIGEDLKPLSDATFLTGIYFSVVTITSLGYGHMHPMGFSKALVCLEVLIGLAVIGIVIAKVTSQRLSYHVSRLFSSDAQKRLEDFVAKFEAYKIYLDEIMPELGNAYQRAPGQASLPTENGDKLISKFREIVSDVQSECEKLRDYFSSEIEQGNYFQSVPVSAVVQVGNAVDEAFWILGQLITSLSSQSTLEVFDRHNRQMISKAITSQRKVCDLVRKHAHDEGTLEVFQHIREICDGIPTDYFAIPESQPDQVRQITHEPKEPSGIDNQQIDSTKK